MGFVKVVDIQGQGLDQAHAVACPVDDMRDQTIVGQGHLCISQHLKGWLADEVGMDAGDTSLDCQQGCPTSDDAISQLAAREERGLVGNKVVEVYDAFAMKLAHLPVGRARQTMNGRR